MQQLHVGAGTTRGALTVFPVWGEHDAYRDYSTASERAVISEVTGRPEVQTLTITNPGDEPLLLIEGKILEGGWQNRMLARSVLIKGRGQLDVEVVCVEQGRWGGGGAHESRERRASARVHSGLTGGQGEVWRRVTEYNARYGANRTESFTEHADRAQSDVGELTTGLRPFPGQIGVVIAVSGEPVFAEIFDSTATLAEQFLSIVSAAAMDAVGRPEVETPSRRARRFVDHAARVRCDRVGPAGLAVTVRGHDDYVDVSVLEWRRREVHLRLTNPRHQLNGAAA
jgi:hypothetical protein